MRTDRELLELAAKAAGINLEWHPEYCINDDGLDWSPLEDDGDALRLVVKLGLWGMAIDYTDGVDRYAATRRAIVRAAAEIGKHSAPSKEES